MLLENPKKRRRGRPRKSAGRVAGLKMPTMKNPFFGISTMEVVGAVGGLAAATLVPSMIIKDTSTTTKKIIKVALAFATAVLVGSVAKGLSAEAGKAATFGGIAGAGAQTLAAFTAFKIGGDNIARPVGRIAAANLVSPSSNREGENVSVIQP